MEFAWSLRLDPEGMVWDSFSWYKVDKKIGANVAHNYSS